MSDDANPSFPSLAEVERITALEDPVLRNLQITQCYHDLSAALAERTALNANWCTFATWASRQAGQTIRKEDLMRLLERRLSAEPAAIQAAEEISASVSPMAADQGPRRLDLALDGRHYTSAIDRASEAVGRGNKKVFEEIGREFARFFQTCLYDEAPDSEKIALFCEGLLPGEPPDGQQFLRQAFTRYYQALFTQDAKTRAELILLANIEIGFHEQTRLQPEIAESLDAGLVSSVQFTRRLTASFSPLNGWLTLAHLYLMRLLGRPTKVDLATRKLLDTVRVLLRQAITEMMMTITLPSGVELRLGEDLPASYPPLLKQISNPELSALLARLDPSPDSPSGSGARDWADLPDRLHFIIDLFRCYQENKDLLSPPFTPEQVAVIKAGRLPDGRL